MNAKPKSRRTKRELNVPLLRRIKRVITNEPKRIDMGLFVSTDEHDPGTKPDDPRFPECGTVGCIAGWALLLSGADAKKIRPANNEKWQEHSNHVELNHYNWEGLAAKVLGIHMSDASSLFYMDGWPDEFQRRYDRARTPKATAKVVCDRIDAFIEDDRARQKVDQAT